MNIYLFGCCCFFILKKFLIIKFFKNMLKYLTVCSFLLRIKKETLLHVDILSKKKKITKMK